MINKHLHNLYRRIVDDFHRKELMPLKTIFFLQISTVLVFYPYLTIHMRELGINVEETAIMSSITPFVAIIMPPVAGCIADRIGNFRILLAFFSVLGGGAALLLLLVPVARGTIRFPENVEFASSCSGELGSLAYIMRESHSCETIPDAEVHMTLESCGYMCQFDTHDQGYDPKAMSFSRHYRIQAQNNLNNSSYKSFRQYEYFISENDMPSALPNGKQRRELIQLKNLKYYKYAIRDFAEGNFYFPFQNSNLFNFECVLDKQSDVLKCGFLSSGSQLDPEVPFKNVLREQTFIEKSKSEDTKRYSVKSINFPSLGSSKPAQCISNNDVPMAKISASVQNQNHDDSLAELANYNLTSNYCSRSCLFTAPRSQICQNESKKVEYNVSLTFWSYLAIRVFIGMISGTSFAMFEGAVIATIREQKADYGLQRIYGNIGGMITSPLSGFLIDRASAGKGYIDYSPAFYLYAAMKLVSGLCMLMINLEFKPAAKNVVTDVFSVLKNVELVALLITCYVLGTSWGFLESFLFWLLEDLGASRSLMGITITVGGITGIPLLALSGPIIDKFGHANVLFIGFIFYAIRLIGYSVMYNPWFSLLYEALESVTASLSITAAITYAAKLSTVSTDSSIQGLLGGLYYGVGKGSGSLIGGYLIKYFGTRPTYVIFAAATLVTGFWYYFLNKFYLERRLRNKNIDNSNKNGKPANTMGLEKGQLDNKESSEHDEIKNREISTINQYSNYAMDKEPDDPPVKIIHANPESTNSNIIRHRHSEATNHAFVGDNENAKNLSNDENCAKSDIANDGKVTTNTNNDTSYKERL